MNTENIGKVVLIICLIGFVEVHCITCSNEKTLNNATKEFCKNTLVYSTANNIKALNLTSNESRIVKSAVQSKLLAASQDFVYYTTYHDESKTIYKIAYGNNSEWLKSNSSITSIAIDYVTNNVYFTANQSLVACSKDGRNCIQLKCCNISYVTLTPKLGWMFYIKESDKPNEQLIMRSSMNGSNDQVYIDGTFKTIEHMTVDESTDRLYWRENRSIIYSASLQGGGEIKIERDNYFLPSSIARLKSFVVNQGIVSYSVENDNKIYVEEKTTGNNLNSNITPVFTDKQLTLSIENLAIFNSNEQSAAKINNPCLNVSCSGLCLLRSVSSASNEPSVNISCAICNMSSQTLGNPWCYNYSMQNNPSGDIQTTTKAEYSPSTTESSTSDKSQSYSSSGKTMFIFIVLVIIFISGYIIYRKYTNRTSWPPIRLRSDGNHRSYTQRTPEPI